MNVAVPLLLTSALILALSAQDDRPMFVDLFCGAGGAATGLLRAGWRHGMGLELNPVIASTYAANVGQVTVANIQSVGFHDMGPVDLLWASPPCPLHSRATLPSRRHASFDGWPDTLRAIQEARPTWVVIENVLGAPFEAWVEALREFYPHVALWKLDAKDFGAPQTRRRGFVVAGPVAVQAPVPSHGPGRGAPWRTLGEVLALEPEGLVFYQQGLGRAASEPWRLTMPSPTVTCQDVHGTRASNSSGFDFNGGPDRASDGSFLATGQRRVSWRGVARLQGFPEDYAWKGNLGSIYVQVGNSVAVPVAEAIGRVLLAVFPSGGMRREGDVEERGESGRGEGWERGNRRVA